MNIGLFDRKCSPSHQSAKHSSNLTQISSLSTRYLQFGILLPLSLKRDLAVRILIPVILSVGITENGVQNLSPVAHLVLS